MSLMRKGNIHIPGRTTGQHQCAAVVGAPDASAHGCGDGAKLKQRPDADEFGQDSGAMRPGAVCGGESRLDCGAGRLAGPVLLQNAHPLPFQNSDRATDGEGGYGEDVAGGHADTTQLGAVAA